MTDITKYHGLTQEQLDILPTRQLMSIREGSFSRRLCGICDDPECDDVKGIDRLFNKNQSELQSNLKAVLATREHVPNKKEAKVLRQAAAKKKR